MLNLDSDEESKLSHEIIPRTFDLPVFKKDHTDLEKNAVFFSCYSFYQSNFLMW